MIDLQVNFIYRPTSLMSHCSDTDSAADIKPPKPVQTPDRTRRALTLNVQNPSTKVPKSQSPQRY